MENKIKENTKLEIPLIAAVLAAPVVPVAAPVTTAAAPIALVTASIALAATSVSTRIAISVLLN